MVLLKNKTLKQVAGASAIAIGVGAFWSPAILGTIMDFSVGPIGVAMVASGLVIALGLDVFM